MTRTVLVIDDDEDFRKIVHLKLRSFLPELNFHACASVSEARSLLSEAEHPLEPDLVLLDHHLPDGKGTDLLNLHCLQGMAVLAVSSDDSPSIPGDSVRAGATYFLTKHEISQPLFEPLVLGLLDQNAIRKELDELKRRNTLIETVRTLVDTLRHEINNPLGAVLGAAYILKSWEGVSAEQQEAARLVEESGKRIQHVINELGRAVSLDPVMKANHKVFQIPGDKLWEK